MPAPTNDEAGDDAKGLGPGFWLRDRLPLETETAVFILANVLDIFMTYLLLIGGGHDEGNPIARFFLNHWGLQGMFTYKLSMVAFVCVIAQVVARFSPSTARKLLIGLTIVVGAVVAYSVTLALRTG